MRVETCVDCMAKWPRLFASTRKLLKKTHFKATNDLRSTCINLRWVAKPWKTCADLRANLIPTKVNASHYEWTRVQVSRGKNRVAGTDKFKTCDYLRLCLFIQKGRIFLYFKSAEVEPLYFLFSFVLVLNCSEVQHSSSTQCVKLLSWNFWKSATFFQPCLANLAL